MKNIPFIIPVHNRLKYTKECLHIFNELKQSSFFQNNNIQIVIVDDGSTDGTGDWIRENYPEVIVLNGDGNLWYTGGVNVGFKHALEKMNPDFIMIWETDIFAVEDYFDHLQVIIDNWEGDSTICSQLYYKSEPDRVLAVGGFFNPKTGKKGLIGRTEKGNPKFEEDLEVDWFPGQGVLIHKSIIEKVGYMDEVRFPQYHSDVDYGLRIKYAGYKNIVHHKLKVLHDTSTTGINHKKDKSVKDFLKSFKLISSNFNIKKDILFYQTHASGILAYRSLIKKYYFYIGSFVKWKMLNVIGIQKKDDGLYG